MGRGPLASSAAAVFLIACSSLPPSERSKTRSDPAAASCPADLASLRAVGADACPEGLACGYWGAACRCARSTGETPAGCCNGTEGHLYWECDTWTSGCPGPADISAGSACPQDGQVCEYNADWCSRRFTCHDGKWLASERSCAP